MRVQDCVRGWLTEGEGDTLERLATGRAVLEIGSYAGRSTIHLARTARTMVAVDPGDGRTTPEPMDTRTELAMNLAKFKVADKVQVVVDTIESAAPNINQRFDVIFVDAGHSKEQTEAVVDAAAPLAATGCMWVFHDHGNTDFPGVRAAVRSMFRAAPSGRKQSLAWLENVGTPPSRVLNVITPLSRPDNLSKLTAGIWSLRAAMPGFSVRWYVAVHPGLELRSSPVFSAAEFPRMTTLLEAPVPNHYGNDGRNECLGWIESGWVWFMDDDTKPHDKFAPALVDAIRKHPDDSGFVFPLCRADGSQMLPADPDATPGKIDTAQFVFQRDVIGAERWMPGLYAADGDLYERLKLRCGRPVAVPNGAVYHNALR